MKKMVLFLCLFTFLPVQVFAFDFYGIKSGMTKEDVSSLFRTDDLTSLEGDDLEKYPKLANTEYWDISFSFTSDNKLWKIIARVRQGYSTLRKIAKKEALISKYKAENIKKTSEEVVNGVTYYYYNVILIDQKLVDIEIEKFKKYYLNKI